TAARKPRKPPWKWPSSSRGWRSVGKRRRSRELALQCLYELDLHGDSQAEPRFGDFWARHPADEEVRTFTEEIVRGTREHQYKIDEMIGQFTEHWSLERMAVVDRNISSILNWCSRVPVQDRRDDRAVHGAV